MKFPSTFNTSVQRCLYPLFQNQRRHFLLLHVFLRMSQSSGQMLNKHVVNYNPSPSEFTSRIEPLIFLWIPKRFISPEYFFIFFSNLYIPARLKKKKKCLKFMVLRLLENRFASQRTESVYFYWYPQAKHSPRFLSSLLQVEVNYSSPPNKVFWKSIFPRSDGEDYGAENITKIKLSKMLVTSFDIFHHLQPLRFWFLVCCVIV